MHNFMQFLGHNIHRTKYAGNLFTTMSCDCKLGRKYSDCTRIKTFALLQYATCEIKIYLSFARAVHLIGCEYLNKTLAKKQLLDARHSIIFFMADSKYLRRTYIIFTFLENKLRLVGTRFLQCMIIGIRVEMLPPMQL